jgi:hypothetical protein
VIAMVAADTLAAEIVRQRGTGSDFLLASRRDADRRSQELVAMALVEAHPNVMGPVVDSAAAVSVQILDVAVGPSTAGVRVSLSGCSWPMARSWGYNVTYRFARAPGTWLFVRREGEMWGHGPCGLPRPAVPTPSAPAFIRPIPPPQRSHSLLAPAPLTR